MHIAVTARFLLPGGHLEGLGRFTLETLRCLVRQQPACTFHLLLDRPADPRYRLGPNVVLHVLPPPARHPVLLLAWYEVAVAGWLRRHRPAALLSPEGLSVLGTRTPRVVVFHDLAYLHRPRDVSALVRRYYAFVLPRLARAAEALVAVSEATRQDVARHYGRDPAGIRVAYNAPGAQFAPQSLAQQAATRQRFSQGQPYFLFVGALQPRKNLLNLLLAFAQFRAGAGAGAGDEAAGVQLLLVGREAWQTGPLLAAYQALPPAVRAAVRFTGRVADADLADLYAAALATTYIPFLEGFGIPVVEAQASGCPVLTSDCSSLPEVAGGAAVLCDPHDPAAIAHGLRCLAQDAGLRQRLVAAGLRNVRRFSWERSAEVLWEAVLEVRR